jgi:hypothetical protein
MLAQPAAGLLCACVPDVPRDGPPHRGSAAGGILAGGAALYVDRLWHIQCGFAVNCLCTCCAGCAGKTSAFLRAGQRGEWQLLQQQLCSGRCQHLLLAGIFDGRVSGGSSAGAPLCAAQLLNAAAAAASCCCVCLWQQYGQWQATCQLLLVAEAVAGMLGNPSVECCGSQPQESWDQPASART